MNARTPPVPVTTAQTAATPPAGPDGAGLVTLDSAIFKDVRVSLKARLGETTLSVDELLQLKTGSVLKLERLLSELVELRLNDAVIARGEIVAVDDHFGVRILEIAPAA